MHKWFLVLTGSIYLGDPGLSYLESIGEMKELIVAVVISLPVVPWVVPHVDH